MGPQLESGSARSARVLLNHCTNDFFRKSRTLELNDGVGIYCIIPRLAFNHRNNDIITEAGLRHLGYRIIIQT